MESVTETLRSRAPRATEKERDEGGQTSPQRPVPLLSPAEKKWQIQIIYFIGFMDLFSISMMIPLYPRLYRLLGTTPTTAGLIGSVYGVIQVFSSPVVGKLSDEYGRKNLLLLSYILPTVGYIMLIVSVYYQSIPLLILSRLPTGLFKHGLSIGKAYIADIADASERQAALGFFNVYSSLGFIFGPLISGYLADLDDSLLLCIISGCFVFSTNIAFILALVRSVPTGRSLDKGGLREMLTLSRILSSLNIFKGVRWWNMVDLIIVKFLASLSVIMFRSNLTIFLQERFDTDYTTLGKIMSFNGIAAALAAATCGYISRLYSSPTRQMTHLLILLALSLLAATCAPNLLVLVAMIIPQTIATSNLRICTLNSFLERVSEDEKGHVIGMGYSITSVSRMLAPSFVGVAQERSSQLSGFVSGGLALVAAVLVIVHSLCLGQSSGATGGKDDDSRHSHTDMESRTKAE